ncbi:MAG: hypothetical protein EYC68_22295 [Chloroflexota bacterium]|nr:MAG: hypothetical protein EYC68_22295 [Chloroflexota bacterium]
MYSRNPGYRSFLVRMWIEHSSTHAENAVQESTWRFSVEDPRTGERRGFSRFANVIDFLQGQMSSQANNSPLDASERASQDRLPSSDRHGKNE